MAWWVFLLVAYALGCVGYATTEERHQQLMNGNRWTGLASWVPELVLVLTVLAAFVAGANLK